MLRLSERQFALFKEKQGQQQVGEPSEPKKPKSARDKSLQPENILEGQIRDFLGYRGWFCHRQHVGMFTAPSGYWIKIGEKGMCDWRAERAVPGIPSGFIQQFEFEVKGRGKPEPDQLEYMHKRQRLGFMAVWFNTYDSDGPNSFAAWYREMWE